MRNRIILGMMVATIIAGCATVPPAQDQEQVDQVLAFMERADGAALAQRAALPFLYNRELVVRGADVALLWNTLYENGFSFAPARLISIEPVADGSSIDPGTFDLRAFLDRLPEDASVAAVQVEGVGRFELVLGGESEGLPLIYGMRGPLR
jgi:hypothetical protein